MDKCQFTTLISRFATAMTVLITIGISAQTYAEKSYSPAINDDFPTRVYWGDTHQHSNLSGDAVFKVSPNDAYRFAKGQSVRGSSGNLAKLDRPLDFIVIADHGNNMGAQLSRESSKTSVEFRASKVGQLWQQAQDELLTTPGVDKQRLLKGSLWPGDRKDVAVRHPGFRQSIWQSVTSAAPPNPALGE